MLEEAKGLSGDESAKWLEKMHQFRQRIYKDLREHIKKQGRHTYDRHSGNN